MKKKYFFIYASIGVFLSIVSCKDKKETYVTNEKVETYCTISEKEFDTWFATGKASENGAVMNANSVDFVHNNNCDFYKWSYQMFLWMTSSNQGKTVVESPQFYTVSPKGTDGKREFIPHKDGQMLRAMANVDKTGKINTEEGQATDDVLMDRNGNLIYYISFANDVYAQFLTAVDNNKMSGNTFPTTKLEMDSIVNFAKEHNYTLADSTALALELKTSWVVADSLINASDYILIDAIIPTYKKTDTLWTIDGERVAKLAMVGMHIVGSTSGHPEMVWATFEHKNVAPNLSYQYMDDNGNIVTVPADGDGDWLLNSNVKDPANVSHMTFKGDQIIANKGFTISPSNTTRTKPYGSSFETQPNPEDTTPAIANTRIIQLNKTIGLLLPGKDVRKNYFLIGATWTNNGSAPNGISYSPENSKDGVAIGSSQLANSTMETYAQNGTSYNEYGSCFSCHSNNGLKPSDLSHVYGKLKPLYVVEKK